MTFVIKVEPGKEALKEFHDFLDVLDFPFFENEFSHEYNYRLITSTQEVGGDLGYSEHRGPLFRHVPLMLYTFANTRRDK